MKIHVCSLSRVTAHVGAVEPSHVISLLSPGDEFPAFPHLTDRHHKTHLHDIREDIEGQVSPGHAHVASVIEFLEAWDPAAPLVVHCWAGISRSSATAFTAACVKNPDADEQLIADALRVSSPTAWPNSRIVQFADDILGRGGRMVAAIEGIGRGEYAYEAEPFSIPARFGPASDGSRP